MARAPYKLPNVFVGCPYDEKKFKFSAFKQALDRLPFRWYYADTSLSTKHLLGVLTGYIKAVDFCIFDVSLWNPNVALEIGLAAGLGVDYYIIVNHSLTKGVPADIQGLQRIQYQSATGLGREDLIPNLVKYLIKEYTHPRNIWDELGYQNREKKYLFALAALAHLRDNKRLTSADAGRIGKGTYLRDDGQQQVLHTLASLGLITEPGRGKGCALKRNLFPEVLRVGRSG